MADPWKSSKPLTTCTVVEQEQTRIIIYDHTGQPYARPKQPIGFIDPNKLPRRP